MIRWSFLPFLASLCGCAHPVAPTGGPVDSTPPDVIGMYPPSNSVDFAGDRIRFEFSERVEKASFERSFSVVPEFAHPPKLHWKGSELEMILAEPLAEATTYVITIDNNLRDEHGVALKEPIVRAIATGSVIDNGAIAGRLLSARSGKPVPDINVVAVRTDTVGGSAAPSGSYRTQTGPDGTFKFKFLPRAPFSLFAFEDRNRNRVRDRGEQFAVSPRAVFVPSSEDSLGRPVDWWVVNPDTTAPAVLDVTARSSRRIEVRYSEPVQLDGLWPQDWLLRDTTSGSVTTVEAVYLLPADKRRVILLTDSLAASTYRIETFGAVRDSSGNLSESRPRSFEASNKADTLRLRFLGFDPQTADSRGAIPLTLRQVPGLRFNENVSAELLRSHVSVEDVAGTRRLFEPRSVDGTLWRLDLQPPLSPGEVATVKVAGALVRADSQFTAEFRRLGRDETGSLTGYVESSGAIVAELYAEQGKGRRLETSQQTDGEYRFEQLPVGNFKLRMFADRNGDGAWQWGETDPYTAPEAMRWYPDSARVRAGWETVLDTLRLTDPGGE